MQIGTKFIESRLRMTNRPVDRVWEVAEDLGNGYFKLKLLYCKYIQKVNPEYREVWSKQSITECMIDTPFIPA